MKENTVMLGPKRHLLCCAGLWLVGLGAGCGEPVAPVASPGVTRLELATEPERPAVFFDHDRHTQTLGDESCKDCHAQENGGRLRWSFRDARDGADAEAVMERFHDACIGCHESRVAPTGPVVCAGCHPAAPARVPGQAAMRFDYSLHARHAQAYPEKCDTCHHEQDPVTKKLRPAPGKETSCTTCHGEHSMDGVRSLRDAAHAGCIRCHRDQTAAGKKSGPATCAGCHEAKQQAAFARLEQPPRLLRNQPDRLWVTGSAKLESAVPFDHLSHEGAASACSDCHHRGLDKCSTCHTLAGDAQGRTVTLASAHHDDASTHSCVGCHRRETTATACAGCHDPTIPGTPSAESCAVCHRGATSNDALAAAPLPAPAVTLAALETLPLPSEPVLTLDMPGEEYLAAKLPHAAIVAKLDQHARQSRLAAAFHQRSETLCAGCHHHAPAGTRPARCVSCHAVAAAANTEDQPDLKTAYHRQCIGCHERMKLKTGCSDCHAEKEGGARP
jgi:predicted CXXCH cytochrome family protein